MSTNCLIKELKTVIDNDSLCELGEIKVVLSPGQHFGGSILQNSSQGAKISLVSGDATVNTPSGSSLPFSIPYNVAYVDSVVDIVAGVNGACLSIKETYPLVTADGIISNIPISISDLQIKFPNYKRYQAKGTNSTLSQIYGDLKDFKAGYDVDILLCGGNTYGDIKYVGRLTSCTSFQVLENCEIYGEIKELVSIARSNGRTTSSSSVTLLVKSIKDITFDGDTINKDSSGRYSATLSWTETTITCNGITINA